MARCYCLLCVALVWLGGLGGCSRTPPLPRDLTPEEEKQYDLELRSRVEKEAEGSGKRKGN
jgi:hypothetical protein